MTNSTDTSRAIVASVDFIGEYFYKKYHDQTWYQKFSNTTVTAIGAMVTIMSQAAAFGFEIPEIARLVLLGVTVVGTVTGVFFTHNGFSKSQYEKLNNEVEGYLKERQRKLNRNHVHMEEGESRSNTVVEDTPVTVQEIKARIKDELEDKINKELRNLGLSS